MSQGGKSRERRRFTGHDGISDNVKFCAVVKLETSRLAATKTSDKIMMESKEQIL
jgi:hypothetical protein